jgi:hypothetical protein
MPIGQIASSKRLGIANLKAKNASSFAATVLRLPANIPIYQQQLVHNTEWAFGPHKAAAEWCGSLDSEYSQSTTIRQISAADTVFSRRNLADPNSYDLLWHRSSYTNQLYYVVNEPDLGSTLGSNHTCTGVDCWDPRDRLVDSHLSAYFPDPNNQFWEAIGDGFTHACPTNPYSYKRIRPDALAFMFLRLKRQTEALGRGHIVLPPSAAERTLGDTDPYWQSYYDYVNNGVTIGSNSENGITPQNMRALHVHHYSLKPYIYPTMTPPQSVAWDATKIRKGADWYRNRYNSGNPIPVDVLISEFGLDWQIRQDPSKEHLVWTGGWPGFHTGLSWWNTYLCWLTRTGPGDCNLQGWDTGAHVIHASIHEPHLSPYITELTPAGKRNQWYFNSDAWATYVIYDATMIEIAGLTVEAPFHAYQRSFTALDSISWESKTWRATPFGNCYTVWANVGADPVSGNLATGWVSNTQSGVIGTTSVQLPKNWSTVYFPIIKNMGSFPTATQISVRWIRPSDGAVHDRGFLDMRDFYDSGVYTYNGINQSVYSAMVFPVVCYASAARTVNVRLSRNLSGPEVWVGRPIVLPGACSWFIEH